MNPLFDGCPTDEALKEVQAKLKDVTAVKPASHRLAELFALVFRENFMGMPYHLWEGASKSNWTYHTAFAIRETARVLRLNCIFEASGRLDARIETLEKKPRIVLLAEWESDYKSVFGEGKELDKLWKGLSRKRYPHALLLTYCPSSKYYSFVKDVIEYWQKRATKLKYYPILYLLVVVYKQRVLQLIRTTEVHSEEVLLWDDFPLA